ncbi:unnamed protein product [Scytosiphon promiscuus]
MKGTVNENNEMLVSVSSRDSAATPVASVPKGKPSELSWHVPRDHVVDAVYNHLSAAQEPQVVGLVGRSGSGKTTCAASVVGEPRGDSPHRANETRDQMIRRRRRVREHFRSGVVWLRVGRGAGVAERIPALMSRLATKVYEELADSYGYAPGASPNGPNTGSAFVQNFVEGTAGVPKRCLVVADDVWEADVVEELRRTGMWVLFTTRDDSVVDAVKGSFKVPVDKVSNAEANLLLRGAAGLPTGASLPPAATKIVELCDRMANRLEFVGRWSTVEDSEDEKDWAEAVSVIDTEMRAIMAQTTDPPSNKDLSEARRVAILRAGFHNLVDGKPLNAKLYLSLAVMPDGRAFGAAEAAVLLYDDGASDNKVLRAAKVVGKLEQWAVVTMHGDLFRMHDTHIDFARTKLKDSEDVRASAVKHWEKFISTLDTIRSTDYFVLVDLWRATEAVGGHSWRRTLPYHAAVAALDDRDPECIPSLKALVEFGINQSAWRDTNEVARRLLLLQEDGAAKDEEVRQTLESMIHCANALGLADADALRDKLSSMVDTAWETREVDLPPRRAAARLLERGQQLAVTQRPNDAYEAITEALDIQKGIEGLHDLEMADTLEFLATVMSDQKEYDRCVTTYEQCLRIKEDHYGRDHLSLTVTLHNLAANVLKCGGDADVQKASGLFLRALKILEAKTGVDNDSMLRTLTFLFRCAEKAGKSDEAEQWHQRIRRLQDSN